MNTEQKLAKICRNIDLLMNENAKTSIITRKALEEIIVNQLDITSANAIGKWIRYLIAKNIIEPNPTSELSKNKRVTKPTPDTRYVVNRARISEFRERERYTLTKFLPSNSSNPTVN